MLVRWCGVGIGLQGLNGIEVLIKRLSVDGGEVVNISALGADKER